MSSLPATATEPKLVRNRLLQTGNRVAITEIQPGHSGRARRLQQFGGDARGNNVPQRNAKGLSRQPGVRQGRLGVGGELLRGNLVVEKLKSELDHGMHGGIDTALPANSQRAPSPPLIQVAFRRLGHDAKDTLTQVRRRELSVHACGRSSFQIVRHRDDNSAASHWARPRNYSTRKTGINRSVLV